MTKNDELIGKLVSVADVLKLAKVALKSQYGACTSMGRKICKFKTGFKKVLQAHRARAAHGPLELQWSVGSLTFDKDALWMFPAHFLSSNVYNCIIV